MNRAKQAGEAVRASAIRAYNQVIRAKSGRDEGATVRSQEAFLRELMDMGPEARDAFIEQLRRLNAE